MEDNSYWELWTRHHNLVVETCEVKWTSRPRVRPVWLPDIKVNFPRKLRETYCIGTRFNINAKVTKKPWQAPFLYADKTSIELLEDFQPKIKRKAILKSENPEWKIYEYINI